MKKIEKKFNNKIFRINNFKSLGENILKIIKSISSYGVPSYAAETSFFIVLSFAPALLFISSILKYVSFFNREIFILIDETFPDYIAINVKNILHEILEKNGQILPIYGLLALWSAGNGIKCMIKGLNKIYGVKEERNWLALRIEGAIYTFVFTVVILFLATLSFFNGKIKTIIKWFPNDIEFIREIHMIAENASVVTIVVLIIFFTSLYTFLPNKKVKWVKQLRGGIFCTLGWEIFSILLSIYVEKFGGFSLYGSLNTIAIVMIWLYGSICLFFIGGIINHKKVTREI